MKTLIFWLTMAAAWFTHVYACILSDRIGLLFAGSLIPPIGWVHGVGYWFGLFNG
ncbi:hypothetical protein [Mesorhizobium sp. M8A.F.Ca.ET.021.01.1.1]|uniref:hypothetical protein n=1 Tax=Mesorhizobium sp. M8A.F.Ca.ET.021.01.1.1 TaxID=2496757 RepID=UPI00167875AC|nr:hypothetical protein [Mesorhizobium sp. M8A.F.Ca.ET.021.01.1.1]